MERWGVSWMGGVCHGGRYVIEGWGGVCHRVVGWGGVGWVI